MKQLSRISLYTLAILIVPVVASAQDLTFFIQQVGNVISLLIPVVVGLGLLAFLWGLSKFIFKAGDQTAKEEGKRVMGWGIVAIFVMISIWGIVRFIQQTTGIEENEEIMVPKIKLPGNASFQ